MAEMKIGNRLFHISTGMACPCCSQPEGSACTCHEMREENERLRAKLVESENRFVEAHKELDKFVRLHSQADAGLNATLAKLTAAEAELKRQRDYDERVPDPRTHKYFNYDCTTGCKFLVAKRQTEAAERRAEEAEAKVGELQREIDELATRSESTCCCRELRALAAKGA